MAGNAHSHNDITSLEQNAMAPPPFNPLTNATHDAASSTIGNSVVRDLMKVYESLTQSSTPQTADQRQPQQHHQQQHHHQQQQASPMHHQYAQQQQQSTVYGNPANPPPAPYHLPQDHSQPPPGTPFSFPPPQHSHAPPPHSYYPDASYSRQQQQPLNSVPPPQPYMVNIPVHHQQPGGYPMQMPPPQEQQHHHPHPPISSSDPRQQQQPPQEDDQEDDDNDEEDQQSGGRLKRNRRESFDSGSGASNSRQSLSSATKTRKKSKGTDGRWSKRFTWPEDLHRDFVSAIFDVGLKHSSPATIIEHMPQNDKITTERIKSHLQKYRLHRAKSKKEFLSSYEASLANFQSPGGLNGIQSLTNGEAAAHLTFSAIQDVKNAMSGGAGKGDNNKSSSSPPNSYQNHQGNTAHTSVSPTSNNGDPQHGQRHQQGEQQQRATVSDALMLPQLTEAEKQSPIGAAMGYLMGLFFSLKQQLMIQRAMAEKLGAPVENASVPVQAVLTSFVASGAAGPVPPVVGGQHQQQEYNATTMQDGAATMQQQSALPQSLNASSTVDQGKLVGVAATAVTTTSPPGMLSAPPSTRTNLEESNMMKREMQSQMALQNKMRALKQNELDKYKNSFNNKGGGGAGGDHPGKEKSLATTVATSSSVNHPPSMQQQSHHPNNHPSNQHAPTTAPFKSQQQHHQHNTNNTSTLDDDSVTTKLGEGAQGAGEAAMADAPAASNQAAALGNNGSQERERGRALSMGGSDDFWNTDVVDEQLFEFLMNN